VILAQVAYGIAARMAVMSLAMQQNIQPRANGQA
jgi:hypothetical protein